MHKTYAIIVGTNKGASTSVFNYLADHPTACGSYIKQTNFFLGRVPGKEVTYDIEQGMEQYDDFFSQCDSNAKVLIEASPDYMYSSLAADRMQKYFANKNYRLIFLLRHPVSRFLSWYGFSKQTGLIPETMSVESYLQANQSKNEDSNPAFEVLETGRYSEYIRLYQKKFGSDKLLFYFYEDLKQDSRAVLQQVSKDLSMDPSFYEEYTFERYNPTVKVKSHQLRQIYIFLRRAAQRTVYEQPWFRQTFDKPIRWIQRKYKSVNSKVAHHELSPATENFLVTYYQADMAKLTTLIGKPTPW